MAYLRHRQTVLTRVFPHQGNHRYIKPARPGLLTPPSAYEAILVCMQGEGWSPELTPEGMYFSGLDWMVPYAELDSGEFDEKTPPPLKNDLEACVT